MNTLERLARAYTGAPFPSKQAMKRMQAAIDALTPGELIKLGVDKAEAGGLNGIGLMVDALRSRDFFVAKIEKIEDAPDDKTEILAQEFTVDGKLIEPRIYYKDGKTWHDQEGYLIDNFSAERFIRLDQLKPEGR